MASLNVFRNHDLFRAITEFQNGIFHDLLNLKTNASKSWLEMLHSKAFTEPRPQLLSEYMAQQSMYTYYGHIEPLALSQSKFAYHLTILQGNTWCVERWLRCYPEWIDKECIELASYCNFDKLAALLKRYLMCKRPTQEIDTIPQKTSLMKVRYDSRL
ncbi:hypothetical protein THRCLA_21466 [Thraustotheca clavata]|uniref:Uncharacterized protein n=1 Tax=Thraustotheca clavata TaxID=74557 RepID=A0A1V9ZW58_9STRA|nr:hypothetical protein THRCLA_21466 [Thraustotheca clavata]